MVRNAACFAPERIPLDRPYAPDIDEVLHELQGKTLESSRNDFKRYRFEVVQAQVSRNSPTEGRADYGTVMVDLTLDVTALTEWSDNLESEDFQVIVDGRVSEPLTYIEDFFYEGMTRTQPVVFQIDDTATSFTLRFAVGWDDESDPETEWQSVDIHL